MDTSNKRMRRGKFIKKFLIFTSIIIGLLITALWSIPIIFKDQLKVKVLHELNKRLDADVSFDQISMGMIRHFPNLTITLHNLNVSGKGQFAHETFASMDKLHTGINLWGLITGGDVQLRRINLENPTITLKVLKDGKANYDIFIKDTTTVNTDTSSAVRIDLDKIKITNGSIIYDNRPLDTYIETHGVDYEGNGEFVKDNFDLYTAASFKEMTYDNGGIRYLHKKQVKADMLMEVDLKNSKYSFKKNSFQINEFKFGIDGFLVLLNNGYKIDLKYAAQETEFKNILSILPGVYMNDLKHITAKGDLAFDGFIKGTYSDTIDNVPAFHMNLKVKDGMFKVDTLATPVKHIQMDLTVDNQSGIIDSTIVDFKNVHLELGKHPIHGKIKWQGLRHIANVDADLSANLELADLEKIYPIKGMDLKGKLDFNLLAKGNYDVIHFPTFHLDLKIANGRLKYDSLPSAIDKIQFHLLADNNTGMIENTRWQFKNINMNMGQNPIHGYATIEGIDNYKIDADIKARINLADIEKMFPVKDISFKGLFDLNIKAKGDYNSSKKKFPSIDVQMNLADGWIKASQYPIPMENIHLVAEAINNDGNYKDTKFDIKQLTFTMEDEPFSVLGTINDLEEGAYDLKVKGKVDLEKLTQIFPLENMTIKGIIDSDFESKGKFSDLEIGKYRRINSDGRIEVHDFYLKGGEIPVPILVNEAFFTFTSEKVILEKLIGKFGKSNVNMTGDLTNYMAFIPKSWKKSTGQNTNKKRKPITGDMVLICDTLDINEWIVEKPIITASTATGVSVNAQNSSPTLMTVWKVPERWDFTFDSKIGYVKYQDLHITQMNGDIRIKDGIMTLTETGFNTLNAKFKLTGDYDTRDIEHPLFDFDLDINDLDINRAYKEVKLIRDLAPAASNTFGLFSVCYKLKGEFNQNMNVKIPTLIGKGEVRIANAKINGMKIFDEISKTAKKDKINDPHLKDFVMNTEIRDNKIFVKPFSVSVNGFDTDIEGVSDLSGTIAYVLKIELIPISHIKIPFHVTGTYDNPKVAIGKGHKLPE